MNFSLSNDFRIFNQLLKKRPEISEEALKHDLERYYLPYAKSLIELKEKHDNTIIVGVSAVQGTGKTTQGEILDILLDHLSHSTISRSIDDHYITHKELVELRERDPRFIRRGVTHDIILAIKDLSNLKNMGLDTPILVSGYDKGAHEGDGDRFRWVNLENDLVVVAKVVDASLVVNKKTKQIKALHITSVLYNEIELDVPQSMGSEIPIEEPFLPKELCQFLHNTDTEITIAKYGMDLACFVSNEKEIAVKQEDLPKGWALVTKRPDFVFYDGWMLGARQVKDESVFNSGLPALESEEAKNFARFINNKLFDYEALWQMLNYLTVLYVPNYEMSLRWRDQAEEVLRAKGEGMTHEEIVDFVHYFWRSVHPAIHIKALAHDSEHTNQVVIINDDHTVKEILTPEEAKVKYP